jgi:hypothetical protein
MGCYFSLSMIDDYGRTRRMLIEAEQKALYADQVTLLTAFLTDLAAVTDLGVVRADIVYTAAASGFAVTSGANKDVGATFSGLIEGGNGKKASLKLPGIKATLVETDGSVDVADATVAEYLAYWVHDTPGELLLSDGEDIDYWLSGSLDE